MLRLDRQRLRQAKTAVLAAHSRVRRAVVRQFLSYGTNELVEALRRVGVGSGDSLMLHSAFEPHHGFRGTAGDAVDAFLEAIAPHGNLLMVSMSYTTSALEYLRKIKVFDVRKAPSAMGMVSEVFRRRTGVLRSAHPAHPVLAFGPRAEWFVAGHEQCKYSCGPGTPFEKLLQADGKVAFFNVDFSVFTFVHYLEHLTSGMAGVTLYTDETFDVPVVGRHGETLMVRTHAFTREAILRRRFSILERTLRKQGLIREGRLGASRFLLVELNAVVRAVEASATQGVYFYDSAKK